MRKYAIPKIAYILLATILITLSIGYTYAYFSAHHIASSKVALGKISILWKDASSDAYISSLFDDTSAIKIDSELNLERGGYTQIRGLLPKENKEAPDQFKNLSLAMSNVNATVDAYCRIQIVAKYIPQNESTPVDCKPGVIQLALSSAFITQIEVDADTGETTETGWFEDDGYYYYGTAIKDRDGEITDVALEVLSAGGTTLIANQLYLSADADNDMLGSTMNIQLVLEGVQTTNDAYKAVWGVDWEI